MIASFSSCFAENRFCSLEELQDPVLNYIKIFTYVLATVYFAVDSLIEVLKSNFGQVSKSPVNYKKVLMIMQSIEYIFLITRLFDSMFLGHSFPLNFLLLLSGDIHLDPGPQTESQFKFFHWNLNSICARGAIEIPLIEAYNSVHHFDVITISESMLDQSISNDDIFIEGFSREIYHSDHPSNSKTGGVCMFFKEGLPIKRRPDLELLQELIVTELTISSKKIFLITLYRSSNQTSELYENFFDRLQVMINQVRGERTYCLLLTGDFNCRSSQWWEDDAENPEGTALDELIETNDLYQLINEPTNIRDESMTCIDLIITDQPNFFVESGVHLYLDDHCQHQIIYGKLNLSIPAPPPYRRTIWDYSKAETNKIRDVTYSIDWSSLFSGQGSN